MGLGTDSGERESSSPHAAFSRFVKSLQDMQLEFIAQNIGSCELFERLMGFQYDLCDSLVGKYPESVDHKTSRPTDEFMAGVFLFDILYQNTKYLFCAWRSLEYGILHVSGSLMRNVVESVPKSFYLMARPRSVKNFLLREKYLTHRYKSQPSEHGSSIAEFLKSEGAQSLLRGRQITVKEFGQLLHEHDNQAMYREIYDDAPSRHKEAYSALSSSSHASLLRLDPPWHDPKWSGRLAKMITDLAFLNLFLTANSQHEQLGDLGRMQDVERFICEAWQDLGGLDPLTRLYPNKPEYLENLKIKPP